MDDAEVAELPPIAGEILVGDTDLSTIDAKWWRAQIGLVQQEPFLFDETIYQNVAYGFCGTKYADIDEMEKKKMVEEACRQAFADEFISKLPMVRSDVLFSDRSKFRLPILMHVLGLRDHSGRVWNKTKRRTTTTPGNCAIDC